MASGFFGADVDQLRQLSRSLAQNAEQLQAITNRLRPRIDSVGWRGPDADRFRGEWNDKLLQSLNGAIRALGSASGQAETNARQQEHASGLGSSNTQGPSAVGGPMPVSPKLTLDFIWGTTREAVNSKSPIFGWRYGDIGSYIPGADVVLTARNIQDSINQGKFPVHELVDVAGGAVKKIPGVGYLAGAGIQTWNTVVELVGETDFSAETRASTWSYMVSNPGESINAAATAVVESLPRILKGLKFW